jgi:diguanylate cyclase (GGDEF)-like protein/PAS domain S-box-containing protein
LATADEKKKRNDRLTMFDSNCFMKAIGLMNDPVFILNQNKKIVYHNPAYENLIGSMGGSEPPFYEFERENSKTYQKLIQDLHTKGSWTGEVSYTGNYNTEYWFSVTITKLDYEETYYLAILRDITTYKQDKEKHHYLAYHDSLTGLPNRHYFLNELKASLKKAKESNKPFALLFVDVDEFKEVNDQYGHHIGDELLIRISKRLKHTIRNHDLAARFGGDEFVLLIKNVTAKEPVINISKRILAALEQPISLNGHLVPVTVSIGISLFPEDAQTIEELLVYADQAMYQAKQGGKNAYCLYGES